MIMFQTEQLLFTSLLVGCNSGENPVSQVSVSRFPVTHDTGFLLSCKENEAQIWLVRFPLVFKSSSGTTRLVTNN
jgi:hypothetical protein